MLRSKKFWITFGISFAAAAVFTLFMLLVVLRGMFYNIYVSKGDSRLEKGEYAQAVKNYETARSWKSKKQALYLKLANAYVLMEDYDNAGRVIDEAIKKKIKNSETGLEDLYLMRIRIYSTEGKLNDAVNYISSLDDQYIRKKVEAARPDDLAYTPTQGNYDKSQKMTITVREGETVYYTTDGSYPTKYSNIYVEPINIGNGTTRVTAVSVNAQGLVSPMLAVSFTVTNENEAVTFDDPKMEQMVRNSLLKPTGTIRVKELAGVTELSNAGCEGYLKTLSDLELMPNLQSFHIEGETKLVSISQLSGRTALTSLSLASCELDSAAITSLGSLTQLKSLDLTDNSITSLSVLSNITELEYLFISKNSIDDLTPLTKLKNLLVLDVSENNVKEIPDLSETLESLYLAKNSVSDLSGIHTLKGLCILDLSSNLITDAKNIGQLEKLEMLTLSNNSIKSFDFLSSLTMLMSLDVSNTPMVSTKALTELPLVTINASNTSVSTVSDIAKITSLTSLTIANTPVTEIDALADIPALDYLDVSGCVIDDLSCLEDFMGLYTVNVGDLDTSKVKFANPEIMVIEQ